MGQPPSTFQLWICRSVRRTLPATHNSRKTMVLERPLMVLPGGHPFHPMPPTDIGNTAILVTFADHFAPPQRRSHVPSTNRDRGEQSCGRVPDANTLLRSDCLKPRFLPFLLTYASKADSHKRNAYMRSICVIRLDFCRVHRKV